MKDNVIERKSFGFAIRIVRLYRFLCDEKKEYTLAKQLLRCGTSIGANVREALQGYSKKDFVYKMSLALKEANESLYWIELLVATETIDQKQGGSLCTDCNELISLLVSIIKTSKQTLEPNT